MNIEKLENKYIDLILNRCLNFNKVKSLLINVSLKENMNLVKKIEDKARGMGIDDIYINIEDMDELHKYLENTELEDIKLNPLIDRSIWDTYAKKGASMLFLNTEVPGLMSDIDSKKISKMLEIRNNTRPYYRENVSKYIFPWCIVAVPNKRWADYLFKDSNDSYNELYSKIFEMCMIDKDDPEKAWQEFIDESNKKKEILNNLKITGLYYKNSLGTDLFVGKHPESLFENIDNDGTDDLKMIVNMPSYELFTSPDCTKTEGIVYSSKPLINEGNIIDKFWIKFHEGHAVDCGAEVGEESLRSLIFDHKNADMLGEIALVPNDSPISNTGIVFNTTLFDENASCHLAIGDSFQSVIPDYEKYSDDELHQKFNLNKSDIHVDFMIGTPDMEIVADTKDGKVTIFKDGNFSI